MSLVQIKFCRNWQLPLVYVPDFSDKARQKDAFKTFLPAMWSAQPRGCKARREAVLPFQLLCFAMVAIAGNQTQRCSRFPSCLVPTHEHLFKAVSQQLIAFLLASSSFTGETEMVGDVWGRLYSSGLYLNEAAIHLLRFLITSAIIEILE